MNMRTGILTGAALSLLLASAAQAALVSRLGGQAVYDTDLDITWLADAYLSISNTFGVTGVVFGAPGIADGTMNWLTANEWIAAMNGANYLGYSDWRLPTTLQPDSSCESQSVSQSGVVVSSGHFCTGSEMGHLFYDELGGVAHESILWVHNANYSVFSNIRLFEDYWSGTSFAPEPDGYRWVFNFNGSQYGDALSKHWAVWPVRDGDVIPVPGAVWLLGSALGVLGMAGRRGRRGG